MRRIALVALLVLVVGPAHADQGTFEVLYSVKPPVLEATVIGAPNGTFELVDNSVKPPLVIKPTKSVDFKKGSETVGIAIVMNGWEMWVGNDKEVPAIRADDPSRYPGFLLMLRAAVDKVDLKNAGPKGSFGAVITYADKAILRVPMGPLSEIVGKRLGTQQDYFGLTGLELVSGIKLGLAELNKLQGARRVLIVFSDGNDTNNEAAKSALVTLRRQAAQDQVQLFSIVYKAKLSGEANVLPAMFSSSVVVTNAKQLETALAAILKRIDDRKHLTFTGLTWDGKSHDLVIRATKHASEPTSVTLPLSKP